MTRLLQLAIATTLIFVLIFGLAFILNMLLKTTWLPIYAYILLVIVLIYLDWDQGRLLDSLKEYTYVDYIPAIGGLIGSLLGGKAIQTLRAKGYKMF